MFGRIYVYLGLSILTTQRVRLHNGSISKMQSKRIYYHRHNSFQYKMIREADKKYIVLHLSF